MVLFLTRTITPRCGLVATIGRASEIFRIVTGQAAIEHGRASRSRRPNLSRTAALERLLGRTPPANAPQRGTGKLNGSLMTHTAAGIGEVGFARLRDRRAQPETCELSSRALDALSSGG